MRLCWLDSLTIFFFLGRNWCRHDVVWCPIYDARSYALFRRCVVSFRKCKSDISSYMNFIVPKMRLIKYPFLQVLFLSGITLIIGPQKTFYFFARKQKLRGTICFLGGILLVFFKWPFVGMCVETFGFLNLFGYAYFLSPFFDLRIPEYLIIIILN